VLEAKHLLGQFFAQRAPILCGKRDVAVVAKIRTEEVVEPAQAKECGDLLLMKVLRMWTFACEAARNSDPDTSGKIRY